jgi:hypothetical protein
MTKDSNRHYSHGKTCASCSKRIVNAAKSGMCKLCTLARRNADPQTRIKISEGAKKLYRENPMALARRQAVINRNRTKALADPEIYASYQERGRATCHRLFTPEVRERRIAALRAAIPKIIEAKLGWCPPEYREMHKARIRSRQMTLAQSRADIAARVAAAKAKKAPLTFEEQLRAVAEGRATLCVMPLASNDLDFTAGGVSSGWAA